MVVQEQHKLAGLFKEPAAAVEAATCNGGGNAACNGAAKGMAVEGSGAPGGGFTFGFTFA